MTTNAMRCWVIHYMNISPPSWFNVLMRYLAPTFTSRQDSSMLVLCNVLDHFLTTLLYLRVISSLACFSSFFTSFIKGSRYFSIKSFQNWISLPLKKSLLPFFKSRSSIQNGLTRSSRWILTCCRVGN
jgi:hypothetical protein